MTHEQLVEIVRAAKGNGGKVRRAVEKAEGWRHPRFGETAEWYRQWETGFAERLARAYAEVFA